MTTQKMIMYFDMDSVYKEQVDDLNPNDHDENSTIASVDTNSNIVIIIDNVAENDERDNDGDTKQQKPSPVDSTTQLSEPNHHQCSPGSQTVRKRKRVRPEASLDVDTVDFKKPICNLDIPRNNALHKGCVKASQWQI